MVLHRLSRSSRNRGPVLVRFRSSGILSRDSINGPVCATPPRSHAPGTRGTNHDALSQGVLPPANLRITANNSDLFADERAWKRRGAGVLLHRPARRRHSASRLRSTRLRKMQCRGCMESKGRSHAHQRANCRHTRRPVSASGRIHSYRDCPGRASTTPSTRSRAGTTPTSTGLQAPTSASKGAAASTAAHHVLVGLVDQAPLTAIFTAADQKRISKPAWMQSMPVRWPKSRQVLVKAKGIEVGAAAAAAMLANGLVTASSERPVFRSLSMPGPGEWRPVSGKRSERMGAQRATVHPAESGITFRRRAAAPPDKRPIHGRIQ